MSTKTTRSITDYKQFQTVQHQAIIWRGRLAGFLVTLHPVNSAGSKTTMAMKVNRGPYKNAEFNQVVKADSYDQALKGLTAKDVEGWSEYNVMPSLSLNEEHIHEQLPEEGNQQQLHEEEAPAGKG